MAMATNSSFFPTFTPPDQFKQLTPITSLVFKPKKPSFLSMASTYPLPVNVDYLEREFTTDGVTFEAIGDDYVVKMSLENGSLASLMLPSGLITSYKPRMWHGTTVEVLHTTVTAGEDGAAVVQGGVSVDFRCVREGEVPWSPSHWSVHDIRGSFERFIQVELISINPENMVEVKCLVTLREDVLGSEFTVKNSKDSSLQLLGSVMTHLTVSSPDATFMLGLQGSTYRSKQPVMSEFSIIPPDFYKEQSTDASKSWVPEALRELLLLEEKTDEKGEQFEEEEEEEEDDDDYSQMTEKMSRVYTSAPTEFTFIDRGRRNSVVVRRSGFEEFYVFSPGSKHEMYGKYAYICAGPSATLAPIVLGPGDVWRGAQYLYNPSL